MATGVMQQYLQKQQQCSNDLVPDWLNAEHLTGVSIFIIHLQISSKYLFVALFFSFF